MVEHQGIVAAHARRVRATPGAASLPFEELESAGMQALVEAALSFEVGRGVKFTTFAWYRVRGSMLDLVRQRASDRRSTIFFSARAAACGAAASLQEASDSLAFADDEVCAAELSALVDGIASAYAFGAVVEATRRLGEEASADRLDWKRAIEALRGCMAALPAQDREVIQVRVLDEATVDEVAARLGISSGTVKRRYTRGENALRACLAAKALTHLPEGHAPMEVAP